MNTMGAWIRTMRERQNMTQEELLVAFKREYKAVAKSTLSAWETETANPPIQDNEFVESLSRIFNVSTADVLKGAGYKLGAAYESELDEQRRRLLEAYDSGDLERLVRVALSKLDEQGEAQAHRLGMDGDEDTGAADATRVARR